MDQFYRTILVASDGSPESQKAFVEAVELAKFSNAHLYIAHILEPRNYDGLVEPAYFDDPSQSLGKVQTAVKNSLEDLQQQAITAGLPEAQVTTIQAEGSPRELLALTLPEKYDIDLIILGATGRSRTESLLLGSVSDYVIRRAKTQVLVVRDKAY